MEQKIFDIDVRVLKRSFVHRLSVSRISINEKRELYEVTDGTRSAIIEKNFPTFRNDPFRTQSIQWRQREGWMMFSDVCEAIGAAIDAFLEKRHAQSHIANYIINIKSHN